MMPTLSELNKTFRERVEDGEVRMITPEEREAKVRADRRRREGLKAANREALYPGSVAEHMRKCADEDEVLAERKANAEAREARREYIKEEIGHEREKAAERAAVAAEMDREAEAARQRAHGLKE